jgi:hypothetical protein
MTTVSATSLNREILPVRRQQGRKAIQKNFKKKKEKRKK